MTVVEERLSELFYLIPARTFTDSNGVEHTTPKPKYHFGDAKEANAFINGRKNDAYPLIYQISNTETHTEKGVDTRLELVLAMQNLKVSMYNTERWATSYQNVLMPLLQNVQTALEKSGIIVSNFEYEVIKHPNYSETEAKDKTAFVDIVDAIVLTVQIKIINGVCINHYIKFN